MQESIGILKTLLTEDSPEKDDAGVFIPLNVDENLRNNAIRECIKALENYGNRT